MHKKETHSGIIIMVHNNVMNANSHGFRVWKDGSLCITSNRIICLLLTNDSNEKVHLLRRFPPNGIFSSTDQEYRFLGKPLEKALGITNMRNRYSKKYGVSVQCAYIFFQIMMR